MFSSLFYIINVVLLAGLVSGIVPLYVTHHAVAYALVVTLDAQFFQYSLALVTVELLSRTVYPAASETLIVGFVSGLIGILGTLLLNILVNIILHSLTGISATAVLPAGAAVVLVAISMLLTLTAGLIPSGSAMRKDPVTALRSE